MNRLIISPHVDDDVIGCGGLLGELGPECTVLYLGVDPFHVVSEAERFEEALAAVREAGHWFLWPGKLPRPLTEAEQIAIHCISYDDRPVPGRPEREVNNYGADLRTLIQTIEHFVRLNVPTEVYLPWPSYNQDHQAVYDAAMVALRPHDTNHFVKRVLLYEEPDCFWPGVRHSFVPTYFRPLPTSNKKLALYQCMKSQVRAHRSLAAIDALAQIRGAAVGAEYAEAYHVLRWVE